ncbi:hypothetical protein OOK60_11820 [Trichothermofontia sichuanensis B231]|uniref:hypothetical protein n=1 Tax=Trichothermofontia sichuanensis TaxID=3045816 RepID=UPI00224857C6|nr:hypothetical protein [Trichothermofontia sichuanensis]UZQ53197.1 hypothetical protein OOK60_11820 [Trichothermofontia sichuanensis B231]
MTLFNQWRQKFIPVSEPTWVAAEGKSIKSTLTDYSAADQNLVMTVSADFAHAVTILVRYDRFWCDTI